MNRTNRAIINQTHKSSAISRMGMPASSSWALPLASATASISRPSSSIRYSRSLRRAILLMNATASGDPDWPLDDDPHTTQAVGEFETDVAYNDWDVPEKSGLLVPVVAKQTGELNPFEKAKTVLQQRKRNPPSTPSTPESPTRPPLSPTT